jgi:hypothetical protein
MVSFIIIHIFNIQSAQACHRYKYWYYKTPQRCYTTHVVREYHTAHVEDKSWTVEITKLPDWDELERQDAIDELKKKLNGGQK